MPQPFAPTDFEPLDTSDFEPLSPTQTTQNGPPAAAGNQLARMNGPIPAGVPIMGGPLPIVPLMGPVLPHAISSAVAYGANQLGSALGLPDWANAALGIGAGALTHGAGSLAGKIPTSMPDVPSGVGKFANTVAKKVIPGYKWFDAAKEALKPEPPPPFEPFKPSAGVARKMRYGGSDNPYGGSSYRNPPRHAGGGGGAARDVNTVGAPPVKPPPTTSAPPPAPAPAAPAAPPSVGEIAVRQHETNVKVNKQIEDKARNLAQYLRSKGGNTEHLDQIVGDPALTRQYLDEAHAYGQKVGNPVPKSGYKGLDPGSDSHKLVRQKILDLIEEEKGKP